MAVDPRSAARRELARVERKALLFLVAVIALIAIGIAIGVKVLKG